MEDDLRVPPTAGTDLTTYMYADRNNGDLDSTAQPARYRNTPPLVDTPGCLESDMQQSPRWDHRLIEGKPTVLRNIAKQARRWCDTQDRTLGDCGVSGG